MLGKPFGCFEVRVSSSCRARLSKELLTTIEWQNYLKIRELQWNDAGFCGCATFEEVMLFSSRLQRVLLRQSSCKRIA